MVIVILIYLLMNRIFPPQISSGQLYFFCFVLTNPLLTNHFLYYIQEISASHFCNRKNEMKSNVQQGEI